jgi:hypothetical protein
VTSYAERARKVRYEGDPKKVERVRQLEALAKSTTYPEEAASARSAADRLMADHGIRREVVDAEPVVSEVVRFRFEGGAIFVSGPDGNWVRVL